MAEQVYLAVDMGASSGRVVAGIFDGSRLRLEEVHRFDNCGVRAAGSLYWDVLSLWQQIVEGLRAAGSKWGRHIQSIGVDAWGVDFALLGRGDTLLANPVTYRDARTAGMLELAESQVGRAQIFRQTGLQFLSINTLFQLLAMRVAHSPVLEAAESLLMMPDLFHWLLTGQKANERTNASTTQFYNPTESRWATELLGELDLPTRILGTLVDPGTRLGPLRSEVAAETGLAGVEVVLPGTHDTASAVMAVPAAGRSGQNPEWCYISSGTWSLMGVETPSPLITDECLRLGFTNEGGVGNSVRLLKNITGLWIVQECRRVWAKGGRQYSWDDLNRLADAAPRCTSFIDPEDSSFLAPGDMPQAMREFCRRTGQTVPADEGSLIRCAVQSLALKYRQVLSRLEELMGGRIETIHIVGGGAQNRQLCQAAADACRRRVVAGPVEATAIGNVMVQAIAAGAVTSIEQAREVIRQSFPVEIYEPHDPDQWDAAFDLWQAASGG